MTTCILVYKYVFKVGDSYYFLYEHYYIGWATEYVEILKKRIPYAVYRASDLKSNSFKAQRSLLIPLMKYPYRITPHKIKLSWQRWQDSWFGDTVTVSHLTMQYKFKMLAHKLSSHHFLQGLSTRHSHINTPESANMPSDYINRQALRQGMSLTRSQDTTDE